MEWYSRWEREKEDREEEAHQAHLEQVRRAAEELARQPKTDNRGQYLLPLEG